MRRFVQFDWVLLSSVFFLLAINALVLYGFLGEGKPNFFFRQFVFDMIGIGLIFFLARFDYRHIGRQSTVLYFTTIGILIAVLFFGKTVNGTEGWIDLGFFQAQPVELAKVVLVLFLASFISKKTTEFGAWTRVVASLVLTMIIVFLVLRQPDLGSAIVLLGVWGAMTLVSGIQWKQILVLSCLGIVLVTTGWFYLEDYQKARIHTFLSPESDPRGSGYNVLQAMTAVGSGGFSGKGLGSGSQSQLDFLPEKHTDFIFAALVEELGFVGGMVILFLYMVFFYRLQVIGVQASDNFGYLTVVGFSTMFFIQVGINIGMNLGVLPVTGIPLPFLSYGGSSLLSLCISVGILLNIHSGRVGKKYYVKLSRSEGDALPIA